MEKQEVKKDFNLKEFFSVLKNVFKKPKYLAIALLIAFAFYLINVLIINYQNFISFYNLLGFGGFLKSLPSFIGGFKNLVTPESFVAIIILSFLIGILFSLIAYRTKMIKEYSKESGLLRDTGIFLGVLAPGCAACGLGLLPALGISAAALTFLPFNGLEISILAIGILSFSTYKITKDINKGIYCEIPMPKSKNERRSE